MPKATGIQRQVLKTVHSACQHRRAVTTTEQLPRDNGMQVKKDQESGTDKEAENTPFNEQAVRRCAERGGREKSWNFPRGLN